MRGRRRNKEEKGWGSAITNSAAIFFAAGVAGEEAEMRFQTEGVGGGREVA